MSTPRVVTFGDYERTGKYWLQSDITDSRKTLIVGGVRLEAAAFDMAPYQQTDGRVYVQSGTLVARTYAQREAGTGYQPVTAALATTIMGAMADYQIAIVMHDMWDIKGGENLAAGVQPDAGNRVAENFLPDYGTPLTADQLAIIRAKYTTILGRI